MMRFKRIRVIRTRVLRHKKVNPFLKEFKEMKYAKTKVKHRKKQITTSYILHYEPFKSDFARLNELYRNFLKSTP